MLTVPVASVTLLYEMVGKKLGKGMVQDEGKTCSPPQIRSCCYGRGGRGVIGLAAKRRPPASPIGRARGKPWYARDCSRGLCSRGTGNDHQTDHPDGPEEATPKPIAQASLSYTADEPSTAEEPTLANEPTTVGELIVAGTAAHQGRQVWAKVSDKKALIRDPDKIGPDRCTCSHDASALDPTA